MRTSQAAISNSHGHSQGLTLIEIIVVMAIIAIFTVIALPRFQNKLKLHIKKQARMLSGTIRFLYNQSAIKNATYRLHYDLANQTYSVEKSLDTVRLTSPEESKDLWDEEKKTGPKFTEDKEHLKKPVQLEKRIKFKDIKTEISKDPVTEGHAYTHFFPSGYVEQTRIRLESEAGDIYTIVVQPLTGIAKIYPYDSEAKP
ncbi:MAG: prepilin-type N-terminal cleavage/methylation domain-containing protein [Deltaproteobacteria bacterium]|nr:prepilin-type N-terminal cleavage/methylation domain-containing protein [Deltaproteobacteria bacterium]